MRSRPKPQVKSTWLALVRVIINHPSRNARQPKSHKDTYWEMPRLAPIRLVACRCPGGRPAHNGGDIQPHWVVGDIGESEWRVPVSANAG
jgi:hypothetical protein